MSTTIQKSERINMRISSKSLDQLRNAAELSQQDLSAFVLDAALAKARQVILEDQVILTLSEADAKQLLEAINQPPKPNSALAELFRRASV